jgi:hypothetical protein
MVYTVKKLVTYSYVVGIFLPWKFKIILKIFDLVNQQK